MCAQQQQVWKLLLSLVIGGDILTERSLRHVVNLRLGAATSGARKLTKDARRHTLKNKAWRGSFAFVPNTIYINAHVRFCFFPLQKVKL